MKLDYFEPKDSQSFGVKVNDKWAFVPKALAATPAELAALLGTLTFTESKSGKALFISNQIDVADDIVIRIAKRTTAVKVEEI